MTVKELYDLNRNNKFFYNDFCEDEKRQTDLYIEVLIINRAMATEDLPLGKMYYIRNKSIYQNITDEEHNEIWEEEVKSYFIETDYQDFDLVRMKIHI